MMYNGEVRSYSFRAARESFFSYQRQGFTLIEMLVVLAMSVLLLGVFFSSGRLGSDQTRLSIETAKVVQSVLRARSFAVAAYLEEGLRICGHGLYLVDESHVSIVRYVRHEGPTSAPCTKIGTANSLVSENPLPNSFTRVPVESYVLAPGVTFDFSNTPAQDIVFRPPDPKIFFYNQSGDFFNTDSDGGFLTEVPITITSDQGLRMRVIVGQGGQVTYGFES